MSLLDRVIFHATSLGAGSFVESSAVLGYQTMEAAGAVSGSTYSYVAQSADLSQWEVGTGVWTLSTRTLARTSILFNSLGTTAAVNFSSVPQVLMTLLAGDVRQILTADTTFDVATTGNDSTGDGSSGNPWATLQHALNWLAANLDAAGFAILLQLADGTYAGASMLGPIPNVLSFTIAGNAADQTKVIITDTGNIVAGVAFSVEASFIDIQLFSLTVEVQTAGNPAVSIGQANACVGVAINYASITFTTAVAAGDCLGNYNPYSFIGGGVFGYGIPGGAVTGSFTVVGSWFSFINVDGLNGATFLDFSAYTMNAASFSGAFYYTQQGYAVGFMAGTFIGSVTGDLFNLGLTSVLTDQSVNWVSIGGTAGGSFAGSFYNGTWGAQQKSGLPAASDLVAGGAAVFKDTSGGGVYLAYNDAGTIKDVALTGGRQFFVAATGSDSNPGTQALPWQTIAKVNAQTMRSGDTYYFNGGDTFSGSIAPNIDSTTFASYGAGQATISSGNSAAGLAATNLSGITVNNLAIVGGGNTSNTTNGIYILNSGVGSIQFAGPTITGCMVSGYGAHGIAVFGDDTGTYGFYNTVISNNTVHDCTGKVNQLTAGISLYVGSGFNISGNTVYNMTGVAGASNFTGVGISVSTITTGSVQNNCVHDTGALADNASGPCGIIIDYSSGITVQYNEVYNSHTANTDGEGIDLDLACTNCVVQYNYIHDCANAGLFGFSGNTAGWGGNTFRFNILQNNGVAGINLEGGSHPINSAYVYNNTVYGTVPAVTSSGTVTALFANNIFYTGGAGNTLSVPSPTSQTFVGNDWYGSENFSWNGTGYTSFAAWQVASGQEKINGSNVGLTVNPQIYVPGGGWINAGYVPTNLYAYNLQAGSPMIGAGLNLSTLFGINPGTQDYFGAAISVSSLSVGAANGDFWTFVATSMASSTFLARTSSFSKFNNVAYDCLLSGMQSDGDLVHVDLLYILAAPNSSASLLNLVSTSYSLTAHGSTTFTANTGIAGDGSTGYLDTGFIPSTAGGQQTETSVTNAVYNLSDPGQNASSNAWGGQNLAQTSEMVINYQASPYHFFYDMNDGTGATTGNTTHAGLTLTQRSGTVVTAYRNGALAPGANTYTAAVTGYVDSKMPILAYNHGDNTYGGFTTDQIGVVVMGSGAISPSRISARINSFMTALGINTY